MKLHIFKAHYQGIEESMRETLTMSKALNRPLKPYCVKLESETVSIHKDNSEEELRRKQELISSLTLKANTTMSIKGYTKQDGRYDYFNFLDYRFETEVIREVIHKSQIEEVMKKLVKKAIGIQSYSYLNCQVMALYKQELIGWDEVVTAHTKECQL